VRRRQCSFLGKFAISLFGIGPVASRVAKRQCRRTTLSGEDWSVRLGPAKSAFISVGLVQVTYQRYISPLARHWVKLSNRRIRCESARHFGFASNPGVDRPVSKPPTSAGNNVLRGNSGGNCYT